MSGLARQKGIALAQVLLLVAIISVLMLSFLTVNQKNLKTTQQLVQRVEARLKLETVKARLLEQLLSQVWETKSNGSSDDVAARWNFYGEPFELYDAQITIENVASLFNLGIQDEQYLTKGMRTLGIQDPVTKARLLLDWQINDEKDESVNSGMRRPMPNRPLQSLTELSFIEGFTAQDIATLKRYSTLLLTGFSNPAQAPNELLPLYMTNEKAARVISLRRNGDFSERNFTRVTGFYGDENEVLSAGPIFRISIRVVADGISQYEQFTVELDSYGSNVVAFK